MTGRSLSVLFTAISQFPGQLPAHGRLSTNSVDGINPGSSPHLLKSHLFPLWGIINYSDTLISLSKQ